MPQRALSRVLLPLIALALLASMLLAPLPVAEAADQPALGLRYPSLTPDNQQVVFAYRGDIWVAPTDGSKNARRLTIHEAQDTIPRVSPDGKQIAFISRRGGGYDVYTMPIDGGMPKQVTHHSAGEVLCDWSPDGKRLLVLTMRHPSLYGLDLYEVSLAGGTPVRVTRDGGREGAYGPDGKKIVYVRGFNTLYQDNYEGGANFDIYTVDSPDALPKRMTQSNGNERWPYYAKDGKSIYFIAEEKGLASFYAMPSEGGERRQITKFKDDIWRPDLSWDGKTAVFEMAGQLYTTDLTAEKPAAKPIKVVVNSDVRHSGIEIRRITAGPEQLDISPGADRLAFSVHGDIWSMAASGGEGRKLTSDKDKEEWPRFSPDGKSIAYMSDKGGNGNIWLMDLNGQNQRPLTKHRSNDFYHAWSPDGRKIVFCSERSGNRDIWTLEIDSGRLEQITEHPGPDDDPVFSPDGEWIAFDSGREGSQAIYVVPSEGGTPRRVTSGGGFLQVPSFSPDGSMLVYESVNQATGNSSGLYVISFHGGPSEQLTRNGTGARWSPKGDTIYYTVRRNGSTEIYRHPAPQSIDLAERIPFSGTIEVDRRTEFGDLFDEAWSRLKDGFYDPKMHGVDWDKVKKRYRPMAVNAEIKGEFHNIINQMLAELGASHLGIRGGDEPRWTVRPEIPKSGHLGLEFEPKVVEKGRRVSRIMPGGPADQAGIRVGDVVLKIGRKSLGSKANLDEILTDAEGKELTIVFRPATQDGLGTERRQKVTAAPWRELWMRNQKNWLDRNTKMVNDASKGALGYLHLDMMNPQNLQKFQSAVRRWNQSSKNKGMILDIRFNGGGNIHIPLLQILTAKPVMQFKARGGPKVLQPELYWDKPIIVLINERSFSDAEVFPDAFRSSGLGKLIGTPTAGGVIGTNDVPLSDGSMLRIPRVGYWSMDGSRLEGKGVHPDILVVETPEDRRLNRDPQLAKAIDVVMQEVKERAKAEKAKKEAAKAAKAAKEGEKPTKEEPKPTPTPEPRPDRVKPPAKAGPENPLADAAVGEWVRYRFTFGGSTTVLRYEVTEVTDETVRFRMTVEEGGEFLPPLPEAVARKPVLDSLPGLGRVLGSEEMPVGVEEKQAPGLSVKLDWDGVPVEVVFTNQLPGLGLFVAKADGETILVAEAWGAAGAQPEAAKPEAEEPEAPKPEAPKPEEPKPEETTQEEAKSDEAEPAEGEVLDPLYDAVVGEWVRYTQTMRGVEVTVTMEVVEVEDDEIAVSLTIEQDGQSMAGPVLRRPRQRILELPGGAEIEDERVTLEVDGHSLECFVMTREGRRGGTIRTWMSHDIPVLGLVKLERNGQVMQELEAWGTDGAPDS